MTVDPRVVANAITRNLYDRDAHDWEVRNAAEALEAVEAEGYEVVESAGDGKCVKGVVIALALGVVFYLVPIVWLLTR